MSERQSTWQDLQFFLAAARGGSLAAAALALGVSSATVHRRLAQLEQAYDSRLFERSPRGYALTEAGHELYAHVRAIDAEVLTAERRLSGRDRRLRGLVRLATVDDLGSTVLGPILADFTQRHAEVELELAIGSAHSDLGRRQADVAIRAGAMPTEGDLIARRVCGIGVALYGSRSRLAASPDRPAPDRLDGQRLVRGGADRADLPMERWLDRHARSSVAVLRSDSMLARLVAVREGLGIGLLPCFAADDEPRLIRLSGVLPEASSALWILTHADLRHNARVRVFVAHLRAGLLALTVRFEGQAADPARRCARRGDAAPAPERENPK